MIFSMIGIVLLCVLTFIVLLASTVAWRVTTGHWLGARGLRRVDLGLALLLGALVVGVTLRYS